MAFSLPPLPTSQLFDDRGYPLSTMQVYWQELIGYLGSAIDQLADVSGVTLPAFAATIASAQAAATAANAAAAAATAATVANAKEAALVNSYIAPSSVLTATATLISVAAHVRHYADGTTASVNAGTVAATAAGDVDYVSYADPARVGGAVTYAVATSQPIQTGNTHVVGAVMIPATGTHSGGAGPQAPGYVQP